MSTLRKDKRGRKVYIGPFDTFVKQLQNIATLFPGMSDSEQKQAANILKQFTSVIVERFGSDDQTDGEDLSDIKPVEIIPLSPDNYSKLPDFVPVDDNDQHNTDIICVSEVENESVNTDISVSVCHAVSCVHDKSDASAQYYKLVITATDGSEKTLVLKQEDVTVDKDGKIVLGKEELKSILSELTKSNDSSPDQPIILNAGGSDADEKGIVLASAGEHHVSRETECMNTDSSFLNHSSGETTDLITDVPEDTATECPQEISNSMTNSESQAEENTDDVSKETVHTRPPSQSQLVTVQDTHNENAPVKRKRGRPKGSSKTQKSKEKTVCSVCGKQLNNKSNLTVHMRSHTGERPYKCQYCEDAFTTHGNLRRHKAAHLGEKKYICQVCGRAFLEKKSMVMHMRRHTGEKPYSCESCGQRFRQISALRIHRARHTGIRNYVCSQCNKPFIQKGALILHMKQHSEGKSVACPDCSRLFYNKEQLAKHRQRHERGISFRCVLCSVALNSQDGLLRHMTTFHGEGGEKKFICKPCNQEYFNKHDLQEHVKSLTHLQSVSTLEGTGSVSELFQTGVHLEEVSKGELEDLPTVKQELLYPVEADHKTDDGEYSGEYCSPTNSGTVLKTDEESMKDTSQILSKESIPQVVMSNLDSVQSVILTNKSNRVYVLKYAAEKTVDDKSE